MLQSLSVQHYALIDDLQIDFREGFSVITGETGSGKSILLGAIGLLLGNRADSKAIQEGHTKCVIEATFCLRGYHLEAFFQEEGFDYDEENCILRRELTATGKSRAFINDSPASLSQVKALGSQLIDIHSQHQNMLLGQEYYQMETLDIIAGNHALRQQYQTAYDAVCALRKELEEAKQNAQRGREEQDYMQFQYQQLADFAPQEGEEVALEERRNTLEHAEEIKLTLCQTADTLDGNEACALTVLGSVKQQLNGLTRLFAKAEPLAERAESCYIELKDIAAELSALADDVVCDSAELQRVSERLDTLYSLLQKHGLSTAAELIALRQSLEERLNAIVCSDEYIQQCEEKLAQEEQRAHALATALSEQRHVSSRSLQQQVNETLTSLGMPNACIQIAITEASELRPSGKDCVALLFSANKNGQPQNIAQVASGGEVARVMLALKSITCRHRALPTIIFDEIDTGVSGRIAEAMAHTMQGMADARTQVIAITHLPQIAASGLHHYKVYKDDDEVGTHSHMALLTTEERVEELAKMLSGEEVTQAAIDNAKELLR
ncbi:MAG: DNA repair protein RecN [Bacteroidaceae bacterium]|nr:DNA repair protein RecN [Bacteroidaceae bacterium]